jgi:hypothetical protein
VGPVNDPLEKEADAVADRVMRMPAPGPVSPCPGGCSGHKGRRRVAADAEHELVRRRAGDGLTGTAVDTSTARAVESRRGSGSPLPAASRRFFEPRFGTDLSALRVHDDPASAELALRVNAKAFTIGQDIYFGPGRWAPGTADGDRLLAHEISHSLQQRPPVRPGVGRRSSTCDRGGGPEWIQRALVLPEPCYTLDYLVQILLGLRGSDYHDIITCLCFGAGLADLVNTAPPLLPVAVPIEQLDCICNIFTTVQEFWARASDGGCFSPWNLSAVDLSLLAMLAATTYADCASLPIGAAVGSMLFGSGGVAGGGAAGGEVGGPPGLFGGGLLGGVVGAGAGVAIGDFIVDVAAMALQNFITQGTPLPAGQCEACSRAFGASLVGNLVCGGVVGSAPGRPQ